MKEILRKLLKVTSHRYPFIGFLIKRLNRRPIVNSVKRKVKGKNNTIIYSGAILHSVLFDISGNDNVLEIMGDCILTNVIFYIRGNGHRILIKSRCHLRGKIWLEDDDCSLTIGVNSTFEDVHIAITEPYSRITIGHDCMFANDIDVRTGDSHSIICKETNERINYAKDVFIGDRVWVGAHCILLKGTSIPDDSVIGSGSVVVKQYTSKGIIIAGNPAKQIKQGIAWTRKRIYKTS
jgi:acetyltransferase-like isoleucine patch superfamily enzyme